MASKCGNCHSLDTVTGADSFTCHSCGARTDYDGNVVADANPAGDHDEGGDVAGPDGNTAEPPKNRIEV